MYESCASPVLVSLGVYASDGPLGQLEYIFISRSSGKYLLHIHLVILLDIIKTSLGSKLLAPLISSVSITFPHTKQ